MNYEFDILGNYGHGLELVTCEETREAAKEQLKVYRENEPGIFFKIKRVAITPPPVIKKRSPKKQIKQYIIDCINLDYYGPDAPPPGNSDKDKLTLLYNAFKSEHGFMIERIGPRPAFKEWISGGPSVFNIEYSNYGIIKMCKRWLLLRPNSTDAKCWKQIEIFYSRITQNTFELFEKHKVI